MNVITSLLNQAFFLISNLPLWPPFTPFFNFLCPRQIKQLVWKRSNSACQNDIYFYISNEKKGRLKGNINQSISGVLERDTKNVKSWTVFDQRCPDANIKTNWVFYIIYSSLHRARRENKTKGITGHLTVIKGNKTKTNLTGTKNLVGLIPKILKRTWFGCISRSQKTNNNFTLMISSAHLPWQLN